MDYQDYLTKADYVKLEKQRLCDHSKFKIMIRCGDCGKLNTIEVQDISLISCEIEKLFFCCVINEDGENSVDSPIEMV
jgi:hypothetical protein